jgi:hypothetical protein
MEPERLLGKLAALAKEGAGGITPALVSITACEDQVTFKGEESESILDAVVWECGHCTVVAAQLYGLLKQYAQESSVTFSVDTQGLRVGSAWMPILSFGSWVLPPGVLQEDFATD